MIDVDISNVWGAMSLPDLLKAEDGINRAHRNLLDADGNFRLPLPGEAELLRLEALGQRIRRESDVLVVLGMGQESLCARGAMELLQGADRNESREKGEPRIIFAGSDFSSRRWSAVLKSLEGKDVSLCVLPGQKEEPETLVALRSLKWNLERRYGTDGARARIYAAGGSDLLAGMAREEGWTFLDSYGEGVCAGIFGPGVLLILAAAGVDIRQVLSGVRQMQGQCALLSYENPLWLYVGAREGLLGRGKNVELLRAFEPDFRELGVWWQALVIRENPRGSFPVSALPGMMGPTDPSRENVFETLVSFAPPRKQIFIQEDARNTDGLNNLSGRSLEQLQQARRRAMAQAAEESAVGIISLCFGEVSAETLGGVLCFFGLGCALSAAMEKSREEMC